MGWNGMGFILLQAASYFFFRFWSGRYFKLFIFVSFFLSFIFRFCVVLVLFCSEVFLYDVCVCNLLTLFFSFSFLFSFFFLCVFLVSFSCAWRSGMRDGKHS